MEHALLIEAADEAAENPSRRVTDRVILDRERLSDLRCLDSDGPGPMSEIVELFISNTSHQLRLLVRAVEAIDCGEVAREAHSLKGASFTLGVRRLGERAAALERMADAGNLSGADRLLDELLSAFDGVPDALREEV